MPQNMINVAEQFSRYPGGRFRAMGPFSGEEFRDDMLIPALRAAMASSSGPVVVVLDGAVGYPASFLEEAFGGLVRKKAFSPSELRQLLQVQTRDPRYAVYGRLARKYMTEELERAH
jgi:hypothetical protein